jgi:DNA helicase-2/ATP-dependent DNA helicase PcrA
VKTSIEDFLSMLSFYRDKIMSGNDMAATVESLVENIDYWGWLIQEYQNNEKIATYKYRNITLFIDMLRRWERDPDTIDPNLYAFLNRITLITRDEADEEEQRGKVNLMTIHAAKGLEFDIVFLVGLEDGIIPHARSLEESDGNIEEERRLFYVAMTRAKNHLFLSSCLKRRYMNKTVECLPSPFIEEIPQELLTINTAHDPVDSNEAEDFFAKIHSKFT